MKTTRRRFLASSLAAVGAISSPMRPSQQSKNVSSFDPWVEVNSDNLAHNVAQIAHLTNRPILAVIKNNGYGLGLTNVAKIFESQNAVAGLAVVKLEEAHLLRDGGIRKPVLLMGPFSEKELDDLVSERITPMIYTPLGKILDATSARIQKAINIHICVDTGIGRVGVPYKDAVTLIEDLAARKSVRIQGIMMTFTEDREFDEEQFARFRSLVMKLAERGISVGTKHAVSSFGLFQHPDKFLDMVRPGMALYGIFPEQQFRGTGILNLKPGVSLRTRVIFVKKLAPGDSAGYNRVYKTDHDVWIATLPVGHSDGLPRAVTKGGAVRIRGRHYPIVAISASHTIVEIGTEESVQAGDIATVFDWQDDSRPEDFAASFEGSVYDLTMHLNPLLPRVLV